MENDAVNKPHHYMVAGIEVRDIQKELCYPFFGQEAADLSNAIKYLLRATKKGKMIEDLRKCQKHIDWLIQSREGGESGQ